MVLMYIFKAENKLLDKYMIEYTIFSWLRGYKRFLDESKIVKSGNVFVNQIQEYKKC